MKKLLILSAFIITSLILISCNTNMTYELNPIYVFDTAIGIRLDKINDDYKLSEEEAKNHYKVISNKLNELSRITNDFDTNENHNSIYDLNEKRELEATQELVDIIKFSVDLIEDTNGYFNPFMGKLNHIWKDAIKERKLPNDDLIKEELAKAKETTVKIENNKVSIVGEGNIDLGGVVKGYALEWMRKYLDSNKITKYVIDCGSSSVYIGDSVATVAITMPYNSGYIEKLSLKNRGVATSNGKYQNMVIDGKRYHHLLNPFTGYPSDNYESVSVIGNIDNGLLDAYSTAIFSMSKEEYTKFCTSKGIEVIVLNHDDTVNRIVY